MRFVWALAGMLLLTMGTAALLGAAALGLLTGHADPGGAFTARMETVQTPGHAVVVTDLDTLMRREAPFARAGQARLRLDARTPEGPAFVGLAPAGEVQRWLTGAPHAVVERIALARGPLPVRLDQVTPAAGVPPTVPAGPAAQTFWVRAGTGVLEWSPADLAGQRLSLVLMRPDGGPEVTLDLRAELRAGWIAPATWGSLAGGMLLVILAALLLLRPLRPREVIFVVEPDQVPVLAGRLGLTSLTGLGAPAQPGPRRLPERQLVSVAAAVPIAARPAIGPVPRPETLADLPPDLPADLPADLPPDLPAPHHPLRPPAPPH
ncbi:hypothetical protein SAMN05443287_110191 [Micromonospora phaseoli]|uniref:Uncharacterized protein n=1 Tax=Micromonospora phaseoli TaxID=1144548 RepID=A0A1H7CTQ1_9ACTN|nr:hypothetical protein CLV64_11119 [Micromonospora phaseoli]GIJ80093.1 hypothetical protein Xph01_45250 [Micromonospora phaseoli]SEJ93048.1 hypothetical protein SAMN05443287_110191 [Micromonospora phaseoli]